MTCGSFSVRPRGENGFEQYLLYFVQFLEDLGIHATADLQEQARGVLLTVTPQDGREALERIREALDVYLQIPRSPDFEAEIRRCQSLSPGTVATPTYR
jgi:hypothetical protein